MYPGFLYVPTFHCTHGVHENGDLCEFALRRLASDHPSEGPLYKRDVQTARGRAALGHGPGERGVEYSAGYGAASWSEQESSPPAGYILPLDARGPGGKTGTRMHGYAPRS